MRRIATSSGQAAACLRGCVRNARTLCEQVPYFILGFIPFHWLTFKRFGAWFLPAFYNAATDRLAKPVKSAFWAFTQWAVKTTLGYALIHG